MRVAYIVPPYKGHYSVLFPLWKKDDKAHLFVLRFQNDPQIEEERDRITVLTLLQDRYSEVAKDFNAIRSKELENALRCFLHDFNPTQVVYDFFCLEAREACQHLGIPAVCSIPAMLKEDEIETCSDGILAKEHLYWLWKHPYNVAIEPVVFMGPRDRGEGVVCGYVQNEIWVSFGTVVPRYPGCQERLENFLLVLQKYAEKNRNQIFVLYNVCFNRQFDHLLNVRTIGLVDLVQELKFSSPKVLIFHGGGNTYTEAFHYRVPKMLVVPFFGDQFETAKRVGNTYSGDLETDLENLKEMDYSNIKPLGTPFIDTFKDYFKRGDLLFGQRKNRDALQAKFPKINLHLNRYQPFEEFDNINAGYLPAIADVYNDSYIRNYDNSTLFGQRMNQFKDIRQHRLELLNLSDEYMLVHYCLDLLLLTVQKWGGKIHFVLGNEAGKATSIELEFIQKNWNILKDSIIFYDTTGKRICAPFFMKNRKERKPDEIIRMVGGRAKGKASGESKINDRNLPLIDKYASRHGYITEFDPPKDFNIHVATCDLRIHYYYKKWAEMQFWPWIYLHNYQADVKRGDPNHSDRDRQRKAQDVLEGK